MIGRSFLSVQSPAIDVMPFATFLIKNLFQDVARDGTVRLGMVIVDRDTDNISCLPRSRLGEFLKKLLRREIFRIGILRPDFGRRIPDTTLAVLFSPLESDMETPVQVTRLRCLRSLNQSSIHTVIKYLHLTHVILLIHREISRRGDF